MKSTVDRDSIVRITCPGDGGHELEKGRWKYVIMEQLDGVDVGATLHCHKCVKTYDPFAYIIECRRD